MSVHEVTYYQAKCDGCGHIETDYGEHSAWSEPGVVFEDLEEWLVGVGDDPDFCPSCVANMRCEVCGSAAYTYVVDGHKVCETHEDHDFSALKCKHCGERIKQHANGQHWHHAGPGGKNRCQIEPYGYMAEPHGDPCTVLCIGHEPGLRLIGNES